MDTLAIIPARAGSAGIPDKNLQRVGGRTLLERAIDAARGAAVTRIVVTTDYADLAYPDVEVVQRPPELATGDGSYTVEDVERHVLAEVGEPDIIVRLFPTCPFRTSEDIDGCLDMLNDGTAVVSMTAPAEYPSTLVELWDGNIIRHLTADWCHPRQYWARRMVVNGAVYAAWCSAWRTAGGYFGPQTRGYYMPAERSWDIDTPFDLKVARLLAAAS